MVAGYVLSVVLVIALVVLFGYVFFWNILALVINVVLLYVVFMRIYVLWQKKKLTPYAIGLALSLAIIFIGVPLLPFWGLTTFFVVGAVLGEILQLLKRRFFFKEKL